MKKKGITQQAEKITSHKERRDCIDQRWTVLVNKLSSALDCIIAFIISISISREQIVYLTHNDLSQIKLDFGNRKIMVII
jgi:hypothetical protein